MNTAREEMLAKVRAALNRNVEGGVSASPSTERVPRDPGGALNRDARASVLPIPDTARIPPREPGQAAQEMDLFLAEAKKLGCQTRRLDPRTGQADLPTALRDLVGAEAIKKATLWQTSELKTWCVEDALRSLGVEIVSPYASNREVAECDLGVTTADFALAETGTLVLRSSVQQPRTTSLLPRVHLAVIRPAALRADLHQVFDVVKGDGYFVFVTGPSRTSDIELTLTVGVHGPKALHVWVLP